MVNNPDRQHELLHDWGLALCYAILDTIKDPRGDSVEEKLPESTNQTGSDIVGRLCVLFTSECDVESTNVLRQNCKPHLCSAFIALHDLILLFAQCALHNKESNEVPHRFGNNI